MHALQPDDVRAARRPGPRFSLVAGGPSNALMGRLGLLGADGIPTPGAAARVAFVAWMLPGAFALLQPLLEPGHHSGSYFTDITTCSRFLVAIFVLLATERHSDARLREMLQQFWEARLLTPASRAPFFRQMRAANALSSSAWAEAAMLGIALVGAQANLQIAIGLQHSGWEGTVDVGGFVVSWAGMAAGWFSIPLFMFLVLRWFWRIFVWGKLLYHVSRLPLRLVPLHADRCAGLGFLSLFPGVFQGFVFAVGCVVGSIMFKHLQPQSGLDGLGEFGLFALAWMAVVALVFVGPLCAFTLPLFALREAELTNHGRIVNRWYRDFHARWIAGERSAAPPGGAIEAPELVQLNVAMKALREIRPLPIDYTALLQLLVAAGVPILLMLCTKLPVQQLLASIAGIIL